MDHSKLSPARNGRSPKLIRVPQAGAQTSGGLANAEDVAVAKIARRFAPGVQSIAAPGDRRFDRYAPRGLPLSASSPEIRPLVTVLIVVALLPSLTFGAMFWLGLLNISWSTPTALEHNKGEHPSVQSASVAGVPLPTRDASNKDAEIEPVAPRAPVAIEARTGKDIPFTNALSRTERSSPRGINTTSGSPDSRAVSSGQPHIEREGSPRSDELNDLRFLLAASGNGETTLKGTLNAPDGESIANAHTAPVLGAAYDPFFASRGAHGITPQPPQPQVWPDQAQEIETSGDEAKPEALDVVEAKDDSSAQTKTDNADAWIEVLEFVNLRDGPTSSARVISVVNKGSKLRVIGRRRGWIQVTNAASSETGWLYSRYATPVTGSRRGLTRTASARAAPSRLGPTSEESFWTRLGDWVWGP